MMSENKSGASLIANSQYYGYGNQGFLQSKGEALVRSNSIEVILLDEEEQKKQNLFKVGEDEK